MTKPRHHTLQGICQDVCVDYQQVVEVHRRIRDVVLEENGKVITQSLGTFFCRDVKPRSGVLNGKPWSSQGFFEVGLSGSRSERDGSHSPTTAERVTFLLESGTFVDSVLTDLLFGQHIALFDFTQGNRVMISVGSVFGTPAPISDTLIVDRSDVSVQGLVAGFNDVEISILESDNKDLFNFESLRDSEALLVIGGQRVAMGQTVSLNVESPLVSNIDQSAIASRPQPNFFVYRLSYTFFDGS